MTVVLSREGPIHHIALRVPDAAATKAWYQENFGFTIEFEFSFAGIDFVWLRAAGEPHVILEVVGGTISADHPLAPVQGAGHVSFAVENIDQAVDELRSHGVSIPMDVTSVGDHPGAPPVDKVAFVADPWGNVIELVQLPKGR